MTAHPPKDVVKAVSPTHLVIVTHPAALGKDGGERLAALLSGTWRPTGVKVVSQVPGAGEGRTSALPSVVQFNITATRPDTVVADLSAFLGIGKSGPSLIVYRYREMAAEPQVPRARPTDRSFRGVPVEQVRAL